MFDNNTFDKAHSHSPDDVKPHRPQTTTNCCTTVRVTSPHFEADRTLQRGETNISENVNKNYHLSKTSQYYKMYINVYQDTRFIVNDHVIK